MEKDNFIGFRVSSALKKKIEESSKRGNLSIGEFMLVVVYKYYNDAAAVSKILEKRLIK